MPVMSKSDVLSSSAQAGCILSVTKHRTSAFASMGQPLLTSGPIKRSAGICAAAQVPGSMAAGEIMRVRDCTDTPVFVTAASVKSST